MKNTIALWCGFTLLSVFTLTSAFYFQTELNKINTTSVTSIETIPVNQNSINEAQILSIIDDRLASIHKQKASNTLERLKDKYLLAAINTVDNRLIYGDDKARITLQEYGDIECPYCRKMHAEIKRVVDHAEGVINWEFKHFPLASHNPAAALEAQAIECVNEAYGNRVAWVAMDSMITETAGNGKGINDMKSFVRSFGLNGSLIDVCLASNDHKTKINNDYDDGVKAGISATPATVLIDNKTGKQYLIKGYKTSDMLLQAIQKVLQM